MPDQRRTEATVPDSAETRIRRLETTVAALEQHVRDVDARVDTLTPLVVGVAELKVGLADVRSDVHDASAEVSALKQLIEEDKKERRTNQERALADSASWRRALILGSFTVLAAIIAAAATIIANTP
jgi:FtsZ-binding cell division protein ZapB